ncbi:MAG: type II toxin-antitoxin system prevent-host-death family antitoxin [Caldilineaceae bacterium]
MNKTMPTAPLNDVHLHQQELLQRISDQPIVLTSHSQPAAVLVSVEELNQMTTAINVMLELIQKDRPWFTLPLHTLEEMRAAIHHD